MLDILTVRELSVNPPRMRVVYRQLVPDLKAVELATGVADASVLSAFLAEGHVFVTCQPAVDP